ncbi:MAG: hypothetical protein AAF518_25790 [Spirochaetota bacterium]
MKRLVLLSIPFAFLLVSCSLWQLSSPSSSYKSLLFLDPKLQKLFSVTDTGIESYAKPFSQNTSLQAEFSLQKDEFPLFRNMFSYLSEEQVLQVYTFKGKKSLREVLPKGYTYDKQVKLPSLYKKPLQGVRIAIDPGHTAGTLQHAQLEQKIVNIEVKLGKKKKLVSFYESELAFDTATILADWLRKDGAEVFVTKRAKGITAFSMSFQDWKKKAMPATVTRAWKDGEISKKFRDHLLKKADDIEIFHKFFKNRELNERARLINNFHPHITVIIHYNILPDKTFWKSKGTRLQTTPINYSLSFVPGAFEKGSMDSVENRLQLLRLLVTDDLENSLEFCSYIQKSFVKVLKVPEFTGYRKYWLKTEVPGIYTRNLRMTRRVYGTLCFGESLLQNNEKEYKALSKKDYVYRGKKIPRRLLENAQAYYQGIRKYLKSKRH